MNCYSFSIIWWVSRVSLFRREMSQSDRFDIRLRWVNFNYLHCKYKLTQAFTLKFIQLPLMCHHWSRHFNFARIVENAILGIPVIIWGCRLGWRVSGCCTCYWETGQCGLTDSAITQSYWTAHHSRTPVLYQLSLSDVCLLDWINNYTHFLQRLHCRLVTDIQWLSTRGEGLSHIGHVVNIC